MCLLVAKAQREISLAKSDLNEMDPFEKHSLEKADNSFGKKLYRQAASEYDSFLLEFPKSRVIPYVLFRKARSIDLDNKRFEAIKRYREVIDYYPDAVNYAAPSLYYMGLCYYDTGDINNAIKTWQKLIQDAEYRKHPIGVYALNQLAAFYFKQGDTAKAVSCYEQVVTDFRTSDWAAVEKAIYAVARELVMNKPNAKRFAEFYEKAQGFEQKPEPIKGSAYEDRKYWNWVIYFVKQFGSQFPSEKKEERKVFYSYWAKAMEDKFKTSDDFQIEAITFQYLADNDLKGKLNRLDELFKRGEQSDDRIIRWIGLFEGDKKKVDEYYAKINLQNLDMEKKQKLLFALLGQKHYQLAQNFFDKIALEKMGDSGRAKLMQTLYPYVRDGFYEEALMKVAASFTDKNEGKMALLVFYYDWTRNSAKGIPLAEELLKNEKYAARAGTMLGNFYAWNREYQKAIDAYNLANNPPETLFLIASCYINLNKLDKAISTLREVENFFPDSAPRAALQQAVYYKNAGLQKEALAAYRKVLKKYPKSTESSAAHLELEKLEARIGGGVDAE